MRVHGCIDERPAIDMMPSEPLVLHDPKHGLDGVVSQVLIGRQVAIHIANAGGPMFPEDLQNLHLARVGRADSVTAIAFRQD